MNKKLAKYIVLLEKVSNKKVVLEGGPTFDDPSPSFKSKIETFDLRSSVTMEDGVIECTVDVDEDVLAYLLKNHKGIIVNVQGDVNLENLALDIIPVQFGKVTGNFSVKGNNLTSLEGTPSFVGSNFDCSDNRLETLKTSPGKVGGNFDVTSNKKGFTEDEVKDNVEVKGTIYVCTSQL